MGGIAVGDPVGDRDRTLHSQRLGCLPIVNFFLTRIGLAENLQTYLPTDDPRLRLAPAAVTAVVGLLRPSFVPPAPIRVLRDYTRLRVDLTHERTRYWQRSDQCDDSVARRCRPAR